MSTAPHPPARREVCGLRVRLRGEARLELTGSPRELRYLDPAVGSLCLENPPFAPSHGPLQLAVSEGDASLLVGQVCCDTLLYWDVVRRRVAHHALGERIPGSEELQILSADDLFLAISENGVLAVDASGRERWRVCEVTSGWRFTGLWDGWLCFADASGNLLSFDAATGAAACP